MGAKGIRRVYLVGINNEPDENRSQTRGLITEIAQGIYKPVPTLFSFIQLNRTRRWQRQEISETMESAKLRRKIDTFFYVAYESTGTTSNNTHNAIQESIMEEDNGFADKTTGARKEF